MLLFSDLHLKPESADTCLAVLRSLEILAEKRGHQQIACLGDVFHVRYALPIEILNGLDKELRRWAKAGIEALFLPGNHDSVDVNGQNALESLQRPGVTVYTQPTVDKHGCWLPYRKDIKQLTDHIAATPPSAQIAFCHHGLQGARMNSGAIAGELDGIPPSAFRQFKHAFFGHWHRHQTVENCTYVGSPWQTRADEAGEVKGCIELDTRTHAWHFTPIYAGRRFHKGIVSDARSGDVVKLPHDADSATIAALQSIGLEVRVDTPPPAVNAPRLATGADEPLPAHARHYLEATAPAELDKDRLAAILTEVLQ